LASAAPIGRSSLGRGGCGGGGIARAAVAAVVASAAVVVRQEVLEGMGGHLQRFFGLGARHLRHHLAVAPVRRPRVRARKRQLNAAARASKAQGTGNNEKVLL